jgi:hypothetical protein
MAYWLNALRHKLYGVLVWAKSVLPSVYGPRGMVMLGQAALCACFGFAYIGVLDTPALPGVTLATNILPLPLWGVLWFLSAFHLAAASFKVDQAKALGGVTALLSFWALSYLHYFITTPVLPSGNANLAFLSSAIFGSMVLNAVGIARMLNHAPSHAEMVEAPGAPDVE